MWVSAFPIQIQFGPSYSPQKVYRKRIFKEISSQYLVEKSRNHPPVIHNSYVSDLGFPVTTGTIFVKRGRMKLILFGHNRTLSISIYCDRIVEYITINSNAAVHNLRLALECLFIWIHFSGISSSFFLRFFH